MIKSIYENQQEILNSIQILHCPDGFECDLTYGNGNFYKDREKPKFCFDIDPQFDYVIKADSCAVPIDSDTINSVVIDPPFLTYVKNGRDHKNGAVAMTKRFVVIILIKSL